jgi:hypothetical protein
MTIESGSERLASALGELAADAAALFEDVLAGGAELPFEIEPTERGPLPMYQYEPRTEDFIRGQIAELRRLDSYLEVRGRLGEEEAIGFLVALFEGRTEFSLDERRLERLVGERAIEAGPATTATGGRVLVPLVGFRSVAAEIELGQVRIVRSDELEGVPEEAIEAASGARRDWGPGHLAVIPCAAGPEAAAAVVGDDLRRLLTTLRLFKPGGVGPHAHGWVRSGASWKTFATGATRPRAGGYDLSEEEVEELIEFARRLAERGERHAALAWATTRFELGSERPTLIEALSDYLLALRALLEGGGPAKADLSARVAALCAEPSERERVSQAVKRAITLERMLISGRRFAASESSPLRVAGEIEHLLRTILRGIATGELGLELRATADEILIVDGLSAGETVSPPRVGETAEWWIREPEEGEELDPESEELEPVGHEPSEQDTTRIIAAGVELAGNMADTDRKTPSEDWLAEGDSEQLEWTAFAGPRREAREQAPDSERVRYLFPVPDETDWSVGELHYDRDRARVK